MVPAFRQGAAFGRVVGMPPEQILSLRTGEFCFSAFGEFSLSNTETLKTVQHVHDAREGRGGARKVHASQYGIRELELPELRRKARNRGR